MENSSNSDNPKKAKEPKKSSSKKRKRRKDPNRSITDLANKYSKLSRQIYPYEDIMKKASFAYDLERQMRSTHDIMRVMEESTRVSRQMESIMTFDLPDMLGLNSIGESVRLASERARGFLEGITRYPLDQLNSYQDFLKNSVYFRPLKDVIGDFSEKYAWMDSLRINPVEDALEKIKSITQIDLRNVFIISSELKNFYANLPDDEIIVQDDQTIAYDGEEYNISEIKDAIDDSLEAAGFFDDRVTRKDIDKLRNEIRKIKESPLQKIIWIFIGFFLLNIFGQPIENRLKDISQKLFVSNKTMITKYIEREIPKRLNDKTILQNLRFVTVNVLNVRSRNYQRSDLIGKLYLGDVVIVIKRKRNWTLIEWQDKDNNLGFFSRLVGVLSDFGAIYIIKSIG